MPERSTKLKIGKQMSCQSLRTWEQYETERNQQQSPQYDDWNDLVT